MCKYFIDGIKAQRRKRVTALRHEKKAGLDKRPGRLRKVASAGKAGLAMTLQVIKYIEVIVIASHAPRGEAIPITCQNANLENLFFPATAPHAP
jgi:hypothetical protein